MIHNLDGTRSSIPYDRRNNQAIYSVGRKYLNEVLLTGNVDMREDLVISPCNLIRIQFQRLKITRT